MCCFIISPSPAFVQSPVIDEEVQEGHVIRPRSHRGHTLLVGVDLDYAPIALGSEVGR